MLTTIHGDNIHDKIEYFRKIITSVEMSTPCHEATKEAREKQGAISSKQATRKRSFDVFSSPDDAPSSTSSSSEPKINSLKTETSNVSIVAKHYNALLEIGLVSRNQSRILYMRNFNNWIKSMLIQEFIAKVKDDKTHRSSVKVLDMCCGKGGDLIKWKKANVSHVICVDIAEVSIEQCKNRYDLWETRERSHSSIFSAEFITADCTKVRLKQKYKDPSIQVDLVSCQFALHYSFESLQQAECMMRNASESLRPGGYFIGSTPDAYDLVSRWQKSDDNKFGNNVYNIEFLCDKDKPPLFGAKYNFYLEEVVNCPEFLVHFPTLCKIASKYGFQLVKFQRFEDFYESVKEEGKWLLKRIQGLEAYSPNHDSSLVGQSEKDYQHAKEYTKNLSPHQRIGTLSQSEWEAISLYAVFAFQKMKTVWNEEGKPEYVKL